jgi:hypothetical protein
MVDERAVRRAWGGADDWIVAICVLLYVLVFVGSFSLVYRSHGNADMQPKMERQTGHARGKA